MIAPVEVITVATGKGADIVPSPSLVRDFIRASKAESTIRGYTADWRDF
jgi:hypothetical protein